MATIRLFKVVAGKHSTGRGGVVYKQGQVIESEEDLCAAFPGKFEEVTHFGKKKPAKHAGEQGKGAEAEEQDEQDKKLEKDQKKKRAKNANTPIPKEKKEGEEGEEGDDEEKLADGTDDAQPEDEGVESAETEEEHEADESDDETAEDESDDEEDVTSSFTGAKAHKLKVSKSPQGFIVTKGGKVLNDELKTKSETTKFIKNYNHKNG